MAVHETPGKVDLRIKVPSGSVVIETAATDRTEIDVVPRRHSEDSRRLMDEIREVCRETSPGHYEVDLEVPPPWRGKWWEFLFQSSREFDVRVTAPDGTELEVETISADVRGKGSFDSTRARTTSGDLSFGDIDGSGDIRSVSGDLKLGSVNGFANAQTVSGDVTLELVAGELTGRSVSGALRVGRLTSSAQLTSISGDVAIESASEGELNLKTTSGDINIGIERGVAIWMDVSSLSGDTTSYLENAGESRDVQLEVRASSLSGDVILRSANLATTSSP